MAVTGAEDTVALSYLQQSGWNVDVCAVFLRKVLLPHFQISFKFKTVVCAIS